MPFSPASCHFVHLDLYRTGIGDLNPRTIGMMARFKPGRALMAASWTACSL
jgi:hypothetical protein